MKFSITCALLAGMCLATSHTAFATDRFHVAWKRYYLGADNSSPPVSLGIQVRCNICHVDSERKKSLGDYGQSLQRNGLTIENFPAERFQREPEIVQREIEEIFERTVRPSTSNKSTSRQSVLAK